MRQIDKTIGLVVRGVDFSETSRIVTLYTRDLGKLGALAKGGRRLKSAFEVSLDVLSVCRICVLRKPTAELDLLTEARLEERFTGLGRDLPALYSGYFVAELLDSLTQPHDSHPALFDVAVASLRKLSEGEDRWFATASFAAQLLAELGYGLNLDECAACGARAGSSQPAIGIGAGGLLCEACRLRHFGWLPVSASAVELLGTLARGEEPRAKPERRDQDAVWRTLLGQIHALLGRSCRMEGMLKLH
ncbi:MAG TPA: DNA repair protein RecO [Planctomycetia bacterium]|nr:DNA repair protein RecO [Planctomycetia bacterium]